MLDLSPVLPLFRPSTKLQFVLLFFFPLYGWPQLEELCDSFERHFVLVGATAIEDKLQEGVPETIAYLLEVIE